MKVREKESTVGLVSGIISIVLLMLIIHFVVLPIAENYSYNKFCEERGFDEYREYFNDVKNKELFVECGNNGEGGVVLKW